MSDDERPAPSAPPPSAGRAPEPPGSRRSSPTARSGPPVRRRAWLAGIVAVVAAAWITLSTFGGGGGSQGLGAGATLPPFAAPLALGRLEGDVNVARRRGQGAAGARPACEVRGPDVLTVCARRERAPVVLAFLAARGTRCARALDALESARGRHPGLRIAAVAIRGDRDGLRALVRRRGWGFPVGHDRDGVLADVYGVAACPQLTFALPGGRVQGTSVGELAALELERRLAALEAAARARGWRPG